MIAFWVALHRGHWKCNFKLIIISVVKRIRFPWNFNLITTSMDFQEEMETLQWKQSHTLARLVRDWLEFLRNWMCGGWLAKGVFMINDIEIRRFVSNLLKNAVKYRVIRCRVSWCDIIIVKTNWTPSRSHIFAADYRAQLWHFYHTSIIIIIIRSITFIAYRTQPIKCDNALPWTRKKMPYWFCCRIERQISLSRNRELEGNGK